ncbi:MAG: hypothetical protein ACE5E7_19155 [Anaerolineae bacterium]
MVLTETIAPWLLGTLLILALFTLTITFKSWREMRRSPYFFIRRQAQQRAYTYSSASIVLLAIAAITAAYAWRPPADNVSRVALLTNAKPPKEEIVQLLNDSPAVTVGVAAEVVDRFVSEEVNQTSVEGAAATSVRPAYTLPEEFQLFDPTADLSEETRIGNLSFATDITDSYQPVNPRRIFAEGNYTLYATFAYDAMADGMEWAWVWRHGGKIIEGGNQLWQYGPSGPGYIYFSPEEGFEFGEYTLEVWVNGDMFAQGSVIMNNAAVSAGN